MKASKPIKNRLIIGLTGGVATGKSAIAELWSQFDNVRVIDADEVARAVTARGTEVFARLETLFSAAFSGGTLNRRTLREIVFNDAEALKKLNALTHPAIFAEIKKRIEDCPEAIFIIEAPLLFEAGFDKICNITVCADCSRPVQIRRLIIRDGVSSEAAEKMIAAQMPQEKKVTSCNYILNTEIPLKELRVAAHKLLDRIIEAWEKS